MTKKPRKLPKHLLIGMTGLALAVILTLLVISIAFQQQLKKDITSYVSRYLGIEMTFDKLNVSLIKNFPRMRLEIDGISVMDRDKEAVTIGEFALILNLRKIFSDSLDLEKVIIKDAVIRMITDASGNETKMVSHHDSTSIKTKKEINLSSQELQITNVLFIMENKVKNDITRVHLDNGQLLVGVQKPVTRLTGMVAGNLDTLMSGGTMIFRDLPIAARDIVYTMNKETRVDSISRGAIYLAELELVPAMTLTHGDNGNVIDLSVTCENDLNKFLSILQLKFRKKMRQVNPAAKATVMFREQGLMNAFQNPYTEIDFAVRDANIESEMLPFPISSLTITGNYNNGEGHTGATAQVVIDTLHVTVKDSYIDANLRVENLWEPVISGNLSASVDLSHIVKPTAQFSGSGRVNAHLQVQGQAADLQQEKLKAKDFAKGEIMFKDLDIWLNDSLYRIKANEGQFNIKDRDLIINQFTGKVNNDTFNLSGQVSHLDQVVLKKNVSATLNAGFSLFGQPCRVAAQVHWGGDSLKLASLIVNSPGLETQGSGLVLFRKGQIASVSGKLDVNAGTINLIDLPFMPSNGKSQPVSNSSVAFPSDFRLEAGIHIDSLIAGPLALGRISCNIVVLPEIIKVNLENADLPGGNASITLDARHWNSQQPELSGKARLVFDTLDIRSISRKISGAVKALSPPEKSGNMQTSSKNLKSDLEVNIMANYVTYEGIDGDTVNVSVQLGNKEIVFDKFTFGYCGGKASLSGILKQNEDQSIVLNVTSTADKADLRHILQDFDNFGQSVIIADSVTGKVSWSADLYFVFDSNWVVIKDKYFGRFGFTMTDAQLTNAVPIEKALAFIRQKSKDNIVISNLKFDTYIVREEVYIQNIEIKNSVSDMSIFGTYTPKDTALNLYIKLSLSDLLFKTTKKRVIQTEAGDIDMGNDKDISLRYAGTSSQHQVKMIVRKDYDKAKSDMENLMIQFDHELNSKVSSLSPPGSPK